MDGPTRDLFMVYVIPNSIKASATGSDPVSEGSIPSWGATSNLKIIKILLAINPFLVYNKGMMKNLIEKDYGYIDGNPGFIKGWGSIGGTEE